MLRRKILRRGRRFAARSALRVGGRTSRIDDPHRINYFKTTTDDGKIRHGSAPCLRSSRSPRRSPLVGHKKRWPAVGRRRKRRRPLDDLAFRLREIVRKSKARPCNDCGNSYPYYVMDLDHVRGEKLFNVGQHLSEDALSEEALYAEIAKCEVVCANCHRERTWRRWQEKKNKSAR